MGYLSVTNTVGTTSYAFPGNIQTNTGWTESFRNDPPGDRRFIIGNGPFTFLPGAKQEFEFSVLTTFDSTANGYKNLNKVVSQNYSISAFQALASKPTCQLITSVKENKYPEIRLSLWPNPANNVVSIRSDVELLGATLKVYNSVGQLVIQDKVDSHNYQLNVQHLPNGIYFVQMKTGVGSALAKLIKN